ncbi:MAG TPA: NAD-dependent epimerase/dehydratase family protein [Planctomycetota bacterium]|nr:NAD-dependent epimerase/dehydratase family protein [Planctomycetota bacterium]
MNVLILGCGVVGGLTGRLLTEGGHQVIGVRRSARPDQSLGFPVVTGDITDAALYVSMIAAMTRIDAVLLAANPGVRRGQDNGLTTAANLVQWNLEGTRLVYTGTTSVYGDAKGGGVDEDGPLDPGADAQQLLAIERDVLAVPGSLILRATALVGPTRSFARERVKAAAKEGKPCVVKGDLDRPFSYLHEQDLAELCVEALSGTLGVGVLNAAAPERITVRGYYEALARQVGVTVQVESDQTATPSRWIDARKLHTICPSRVWRNV